MAEQFVSPDANSAGEFSVKCPKMMKKSTKQFFVRFGAILVALMITGTGSIPLVFKRDLFYSNWRGALVFAPFAVIIGIFFLYLILFKWEKLDKM